MSLFLLLFFAFWMLLFSILYRYNINPLKIVVFAGTFSLAMAFAGNDLVNFIGVPLAGWQSYDLFHNANQATGGILSAHTYMMTGLKFPIQTPYIYLLISGIIMVLTLWFSKRQEQLLKLKLNLDPRKKRTKNLRQTYSPEQLSIPVWLLQEN